MICSDCKVETETNFGSNSSPLCFTCFDESHAPKVKTKRKTTTQTKVVTFGILAAALFVFCGNLHIVTGESVGLTIIPKVSFTLSETFINVDQITGMPLFSAKTKFPLSVRALQKAGLVETDQQIETRVKIDVENSMREAQDNFTKTYQAEFEKQAQEYKKLMKELGY